jgi:hypothetical protein
VLLVVVAIVGMPLQKGPLATPHRCSALAIIRELKVIVLSQRRNSDFHRAADR